MNKTEEIINKIHLKWNSWFRVASTLPEFSSDMIAFWWKKEYLISYLEEQNKWYKNMQLTAKGERFESQGYIYALELAINKNNSAINYLHEINKLDGKGIKTTSDYIQGAGGCCKKCEIYLDYKDSYQCNNDECKCHQK